ncbi:hypothetical protein [Natronomonas salina]|nr:hypothetical protein [Natronomonas salina]
MSLKGEQRPTAICNACQRPVVDATTGYDGEPYHVECVRKLR